MQARTGSKLDDLDRDPDFLFQLAPERHGEALDVGEHVL